MPHFSSWRAYDEFASAVRKERRFGHNPACIRFLDAVKASARDRLVRLRRGHPLWRAQLGHDWAREPAYPEAPEDDFIEVEAPFAVERMSPDPAHVKEGRLNPRGIAFLYVTRRVETAIAEVRPWVGAKVSVGVFEVLQDSLLVNCSQPGGRGLYLAFNADGTFAQPDPLEWDKLVWEAISFAFAQPTDPNDSALIYAPTQILAEVLREEGHDGVLYQSALHSEGINVALFDPSRARLFACGLHSIDAVEYRSEHTHRGYDLVRETTTPPPDESPRELAAPG